MNRIILIGNGFDLAHGMRTGYDHFISDYWKGIIHQLQNEIAGNMTLYKNVFETEQVIIKDVPGAYNSGQWVRGETLEDLLAVLDARNLELIYKNRLLEILSRKYREKNWVDIEIEYYNLLKESFKNENCSYKIEELNKDLNQIQKLLELYLKRVEDGFVANFGNNVDDARLKSSIGYKIYSPFVLKDFTEASINRRAEMEFQKIQKDVRAFREGAVMMSDLSKQSQKLISTIGIDGTVKEIRKLLISSTALNYFNLAPEEILFLNFNYTFTEKVYTNHTQFDAIETAKNLKKHCIHIHGTTDRDDRNNVIFGFGDEIDEDYKSIENLNDNVYLENIKSIKYLETDNYKQLLEFLNIEDYQIFIFGHSCGISDRTLLNTLFEHKNCSSIKPYYYLKDSKTDNYSDIVRNISRNFNSKSSMRDKVVNKAYCESLS